MGEGCNYGKAPDLHARSPLKVEMMSEDGNMGTLYSAAES